MVTAENSVPLMLRKSQYILLRSVSALFLSLSLPFLAGAQDDPVAVERPTTPVDPASLPSVNPSETASGTPSTATAPATATSAGTPESTPVPEPKTAEEQRIDSLERIADSLSERMRSVLKREQTLDVREEALGEREEALEARVRAIMSRERALEARENLVKRREELPPPQAWEGPAAPSIYGKYAAVIDARNGQFFHVKDARTETPVASTQKLLTALIIVKAGKLDQKLVVPDIVTTIEPTKIGVAPGQKYTRREMVRALLVRSGNDIAACLAIDNAGSIEAFAEKMNQFAVSLGTENSNFTNPHGLPDDAQVSTARDMALIAFEAYQEPFIRECVKTRTCEFTFETGTVRTLYNTNHLPKVYPLCNGMKTGFTYASGHCLVSSGFNPENGAERIVVVIGSNRANVTKDSHALLEWALNLEMKDS